MKANAAMTKGLFSRKAKRTKDSEISWMLEKALTVQGMISLAAGFVDQESLPNEKTCELATHLLSEEETQKPCLQYGCTEGYQPLRQEILNYFGRTNDFDVAQSNISIENIIITTGSQQILYLLADVLLDEGDIILVEDPTYFVFLGVLQSVGAKVMGVPTEDEGGVRIESLRQKLKQLEDSGEIDHLKAFYVMTYYMNPKGTCFARERHEELMALVKEYWEKGHPFYIIEDAAYRELSYDSAPFPSIKSLDKANKYVAYTNSFSKAFAPGVRTGYGILPDELTLHVARQKGNLDFGSPSLSQFLVHEALVHGQYEEHVKYLQEMYQEKRDLALKAINEFFPSGLKVTRPKGGLYVWVQLPEGCETGPTSKLFNEALNNKVIYVPGEFCFAQEPDIPKENNSMRLCYAYISKKDLREGIKRLGESIATVLKQ